MTRVQWNAIDKNVKVYEVLENKTRYGMDIDLRNTEIK